jgi:hypothetical protein
MRGPHSGCGDGRGDEPFERHQLIAELIGGGAVVATVSSVAAAATAGAGAGADEDYPRLTQRPMST